MIVSLNRKERNGSMKAIEDIRNHPLYMESYKKLEQAEQERIFCCHQMEHLLDVARIAYIQSLEQKLEIRKEVIYAAALLHDIGKYRQYTEGIPHEKASAEIAEVILNELSENFFSETEKASILRAILGHRRLREDMEVLERLIYTSDKLSRKCFACKAQEECDWDAGKKNFALEI